MKNFSVNVLSSIFFSAFVLMLFSCSKSEDINVDAANTKINIIKPLPNTTLKAGESLIIEAVIKSDLSMHGYEILVHDKSANTKTSIKSKHTHGKEISIKEQWIPACIEANSFLLEVVALINHDGLNLSEKVEFGCK